jgi:hypothetical protein
MTMKILVRIVSVLGVLLGGLWLVQGLGLVQIRPILCFAECEPVQGPSAVWAVLGVLLMAAGVFGIRRTARW